MNDSQKAVSFTQVGQIYSDDPTVKWVRFTPTLTATGARARAENRIVYGSPRLERYRRFCDAVRAPGDHPHPYFPFFHQSGKLRGGGESFWHLEPLPGPGKVNPAFSVRTLPAPLHRRGWFRSR